MSKLKEIYHPLDELQLETFRSRASKNRRIVPYLKFKYITMSYWKNHQLFKPKYENIRPVRYHHNIYLMIMHLEAGLHVRLFHEFQLNLKMDLNISHDHIQHNIIQHVKMRTVVKEFFITNSSDQSLEPFIIAKFPTAKFSCCTKSASGRRINGIKLKGLQCISQLSRKNPCRRPETDWKTFEWYETFGYRISIMLGRGNDGKLFCDRDASWMVYWWDLNNWGQNHWQHESDELPLPLYTNRRNEQMRRIHTSSFSFPQSTKRLQRETVRPRWRRDARRGRLGGDDQQYSDWSSGQSHKLAMKISLRIRLGTFHCWFKLSFRY